MKVYNIHGVFLNHIQLQLNNFLAKNEQIWGFFTLFLIVLWRMTIAELCLIS